MKREPKKGEPKLTHSTVNTGDVQSFALSEENFKPNAVEATRIMLRQPVLGYRLEAKRFGMDRRYRFYVLRDSDGRKLTENWVHYNGKHISLRTQLLTSDMGDDEALMLADLEQCAALMLVKEEKL